MIMEALSAPSLAYHIPRSFSASSVSLPFSKYLPLLPPPVSSFHGRHPTMVLGRRGKHANFVVKAAQSGDDASAIGELLAEVQIFTAAGQPVLFKDLWNREEGMAVVALLRHFGCPCCWELASSLKELKPRFDGSGVKLIAVGVGTPDKARILAERLPFPSDCLYADPERKAYNILGLYYGLGRTFFNPASAKVFSIFDSLKNSVKNYTISATPDDRSSVLQQGGMFVFKGRNLLYARKDEGTGDHAPMDEILNLCCSAPVA